VTGYAKLGTLQCQWCDSVSVVSQCCQLCHSELKPCPPSLTTEQTQQQRQSRPATTGQGRHSPQPRRTRHAREAGTRAGPAGCSHNGRVLCAHGRAHVQVWDGWHDCRWGAESHARMLHTPAKSRATHTASNLGFALSSHTARWQRVTQQQQHYTHDHGMGTGPTHDAAHSVPSQTLATWLTEARRHTTLLAPPRRTHPRMLLQARCRTRPPPPPVSRAALARPLAPTHREQASRRALPAVVVLV
jgi:hypothetical protein